MIECIPRMLLDDGTLSPDSKKLKRLYFSECAIVEEENRIVLTSNAGEKAVMRREKNTRTARLSMLSAVSGRLKKTLPITTARIALARMEPITGAG